MADLALSGDETSVWTNIGILASGETLASTRLSVAGGGYVGFPGGDQDNAWDNALGAIGVSVAFGTSDPGPPAATPIDGLGADWVLREGFGFAFDGLQYDADYNITGKYYRTVANNPMVSKGMRKAPEGQAGYVYLGYGEYADFSAGPLQATGSLIITFSLIIIDAA